MKSIARLTSTRGGRPRPTGSLMAVVAGIAGLAIVATGCGSSVSSTSGAASASNLSYSACMRAHGVPNFPDPNAAGLLNLSGIDQNSPQVQAALQDCKSQRAHGLAQQSQDAAQQQQAVQYSHCMRAHGVTDFPDPGATGSFSNGGADQNSHTMQAALKACKYLYNSAYDSSNSSNAP